MSNTRTIAFVMDPIQSVNIREDTTFALMLEAQRREHRVRVAARIEVIHLLIARLDNPPHVHRIRADRDGRGCDVLRRRSGERPRARPGNIDVNRRIGVAAKHEYVVFFNGRAHLVVASPFAQFARCLVFSI